MFMAPTADPILADAWDAARELKIASQHDRVVHRLRSPIAWFGGKGMLVARLLSLMPPHHTYVEPFCGGASCLFAKSPSPVEVINDLDSDIVNFFRVLRDPHRFERFYHLATLTPYSREEFKRYRANWRASWRGCDDCDDSDNDVERAYRWYVVARMSFAGEFGRSWGHSVATSRRGMANAVSQWLSIVDMLPDIAERVRMVQIEHGDWLDVLRSYDAPDTLFYVDPPFVRSTRRSGKYLYEMDDAAHRKLAETLLCIRGKALLSGYLNEIYAQLEEAGWERVDLPTVCFAAGRTRRTGLRGKGSLAGQSRTESVWVSPTARLSGGEEIGSEYIQGTLSF